MAFQEFKAGIDQKGPENVENPGEFLHEPRANKNKDGT